MVFCLFVCFLTFWTFIGFINNYWLKNVLYGPESCVTVTVASIFCLVSI